MKNEKYDMTQLISYEDIKKDIAESGDLTREEMIEIDISVQIITALINARKDKRITQKELERLSGVRQQVITKVETGQVNPTINTISKLLLPLGKKLAIVDAGCVKADFSASRLRLQRPGK